MWLQIKSGICHHLYGIYTVCYMDWLQMADKYTKLCVVSFYSVYLPVRGIHLVQNLSVVNASFIIRYECCALVGAVREPPLQHHRQK